MVFFSVGVDDDVGCGQKYELAVKVPQYFVYQGSAVGGGAYQPRWHDDELKGTEFCGEAGLVYVFLLNPYLLLYMLQVNSREYPLHPSMV